MNKLDTVVTTTEVQSRNSALGSGVALRLRLAHAVTGRGNIDDAPTGCKVIQKQLGQIKWCSDTHLEGILEILIGGLFDTPVERRGIVDENIHMTVVC